MARNTVDTAKGEMKIRYTSFRQLNTFKIFSVPSTIRTSYLSPVTVWKYDKIVWLTTYSTFPKNSASKKPISSGEKQNLILGWNFKDLCFIATDTFTPDHSRKPHINHKTFRHHKIPSVVREHKVRSQTKHLPKHFPLSGLGSVERKQFHTIFATENYKLKAHIFSIFKQSYANVYD